MESDTTVPGDKLHDPIETPAGKGESTRFSSVSVKSIERLPSSYYARVRVRVQLAF